MCIFDASIFSKVFKLLNVCSEISQNIVRSWSSDISTLLTTNLWILRAFPSCPRFVLCGEPHHLDMWENVYHMVHIPNGALTCQPCFVLSPSTTSTDPAQREMGHEKRSLPIPGDMVVPDGMLVTGQCLQARATYPISSQVYWMVIAPHQFFLHRNVHLKNRCPTATSSRVGDHIFPPVSSSAMRCTLSRVIWA